MMASKVTPAVEKEGAKMEGAKEEEATEAAGSFVSTHGSFGRS